MKSKNVLVLVALMFVLLATVVSVIIWPEVPSAAKIALFAFGYGAGIPTGAWLARRHPLRSV